LNILITGGAGFIGSNLYNHLKYKHNVTRVDNFSTSRKDDTVIDLDISKYSSELESLIQNTDIIYHFAGSVGVKKIDSDYHGSLMSSININNVIFSLCEKYQKRLIFASTSEVYGECNSAKESDNLSISSPEFGRGSYACAKLMAEFILKSYTFPSTICRFFNIIGKGQLPDYGMVVPNFIKQAKENGDIMVYNDGSQRRSFCSINDAVIMLEMMICNIHIDEIYNIGNPDNTISILELAKLIKKLTNSNSNIVFKDTKEVFSKQFFEINNRLVNTDKFNRFYKATISIEEIIKDLV